MSKADPIAEDAALAERAQAGDRVAFAELARRYRPALVALAFDRTRNLDDAHDLAQEALARAWQHRAALRDPALFPAWLRSITSNLCASWTRKPVPLPLGDESADAADVVRTAIAHHEQREIARALQGLPTANRLALLMHVRDGMPYERIAAFLGVPVTTVEGRIFRARQALRRSALVGITSLGRRIEKES
jgi:RNA polymerase sigma-70 factor (ECF subfamily)